MIDIAKYKEKDKLEFLNCYIKENSPRLQYEEWVDTSKISSMKVGGFSRFFATIKNLEELQFVLSLEKFCKIKIIGKASNIVFSDFYEGILFSLSEKDFAYVGRNEIGMVCGAMARMSKINYAALEWSFGGFEKLGYIPGSIGGGIVGNCGAFGSQISNLVDSVKVFHRGKVVILSKNECEFDYRKSRFQNGEYIILEVILKLKNAEKEKIQRTQKEYLCKRIGMQPLELPSCGSVFKRDGEVIPAKIIDDAGLKGEQIGGLEVSKKHSGYIVNTGGGTPSDFQELVEKIKNKVKEKYNVSLVLEIEFV